LIAIFGALLLVGYSISSPEPVPSPNPARLVAGDASGSSRSYSGPSNTAVRRLFWYSASGRALVLLYELLAFVPSG
jgi:hypothetical protein